MYPAHIAVFTAGEVAVVALLEVDAQFAGDFKLHVVQGAPGFGHVDPAAGIAARLIHPFSPPSFRITAIFTVPGKNTLAFCSNRQISMMKRQARPFSVLLLKKEK